MLKYIAPLLLLCACAGPETNDRKQEKVVMDTAKPLVKDTVVPAPEAKPVINDTLNTAAKLIGGTWNNEAIFTAAGNDRDYKAYSAEFSKKWLRFDSTRLSVIRNFRDRELSAQFATEETVFYPFSGPDILYSGTFFPNAKKYILVGLEPVGSLPDFARFGDTATADKYYAKLKNSLYAILEFSFFRTLSMRNDLKNNDVDGVIHVLLLFLNRTGNSIVSARPIGLDSLGNKQYYGSFEELKNKPLKTKGVEVCFVNNKGEQKELNYFSMDAADFPLKKNTGFLNYMKQQPSFTAYLKGASYLLHHAHFSAMRQLIFEKADAVVQDDSGIALRYFLRDGGWQFRLYGDYTKPIPKFAKEYQPALDSLYKAQGATKLDFGLGYNYRDKNSNFMVATRTKPGA